MEMEEKRGIMSSSNLLLRGTSCVGEPQATAAQSMKVRDLRLFTDIVNCADVEGREPFPVSEEHWMNKPVEGDEESNTLLMAAIRDHLHPYTEVLLKAGARADLYSQERGLAPIHHAVQVGDVNAVKLLLEGESRGGNMARVNTTNKAGRTALHLAVEQKDVDILHYLLSRRDIDVDPKDDKMNQTPLYLAVKGRHPQMVEMLVENGANVETIVFGKSIRVHIQEKMPGFDLASIKVVRAPVVRQSSVSVLETLSELADKASHGTPEREVLQEFRDLVLQVDSKALNTARSSGQTLLQRCATGNLANLAEVLLSEGVDPNFCPSDSSAAPVLLAAFRGHTEVLKVLARYHADFTLVTSTGETILHRILLKDETFEAERFESCLNFVLSSKQDDHVKTQVDKIINRKDLLGNTALHYATQRWGETTVRQLLERGANIGIKNHWDEVPINKILPSTMEAFLDEFCLESQEDVNHDDFELTFKYSFLAPPVDALPADVQGPHYDDTDESEKISNKFGERKFALPETESLWYMGQSKEHRHLLRHPVITSFLWCKWTRIRRFVNRNLRFYFFFVMILTWFIFEEYGGHSLKTSADKTYIPALYGVYVTFFIGMVIFVLKDWVSDMKDLLRQQQLREEYGRPPGSSPVASCLHLILSNWLEAVLLAALAIILWLGRPTLTPTLTILLLGLIIREAFQMAVSLRRYIFTIENWLEAALLILVGVLLVPDSCSLDVKRHLAAIALLLSWIELVTFVAKHPRLTRYNVYVTMFYKVLTSFFFFLLWYIFFIIAFGIGFYIMLHKDFKVPEGNITATEASSSGDCKKKDDGEEEGLQEFFNSPFLSFVKTCTMFVGELEFSDIPIDRSGPLMHLSYTFFLAFVFLIVVVLMNLLNGLAVSDTGVIQDRSEVVAFLSQVETISYAESLLLGDPFDFLASVPALHWLPCKRSLSCLRQLYRSRTIRRIFQRLTGAQDILLFYNYLPEKRLVLKPNSKTEDCLKVVRIGEDIVKAAKTIVLDREKALKHGKERRGVEDELAQLSERSRAVERQLEESRRENKGLSDKITSLEQKIDLLIYRM